MRTNTKMVTWLDRIKLTIVATFMLLLVSCGGGGSGSSSAPTPVVTDGPVLNLTQLKLIDTQDNQYVAVITEDSISFNLPRGISDSFRIQFELSSDVKSVLIGGVAVSNNSVISILENQPLVLELVGTNGATRSYTITRSLLPTPVVLPTIASFSLVSDTNESYVGVISGNNIVVGMPSSVPIAMVAHFTTSNGAAVKIGDILQISGETVNDFIDGESIVYTVFDESNEVQNYTVTRLSSDHTISQFSLTSFTGESYTAEISGNNINVSIPLFATASPMMARFVTNGSRIQVNGVEISPLGATISLVIGQPVVYTVFAEDGSSRNYTLNTTRDTLGQFSVLADNLLGQSFNNVVKTSDDRFLYIRSSSDGKISTFSVGQTGELNFIADTASDAGTARLILSPDSRHLYLLYTTGAKILIYSINSNSGELAPASPQSSIALSGIPEHGVITPNGKYLYWVSATSREVFMNSLESTTGAITPLSPASFVTESQNVSIFVTADSKYAYVATTADTVQSFAAINMYSIESNGQLTPLSPASVVSAGNGFNASNISWVMLSSHDNRYLYRVSNNSRRFSSYEINNNTGQLIPLAGDRGIVSFTGSNTFFSDWVASADGKLYVVFGKSRNLATYAIDAGGYLTLESELNFAESFPVAISVNNSGKFAHVLFGLLNNRIKALGIK